MDEEIKEFLLHHLETIRENDVEAYYETTAEDLTLYEWWVTPHRLDGLPFHEFMMNANAEHGTVFGAEDQGQEPHHVSTSPTCTSSATAIPPSPAIPC